jgi:hypothetical protein
MDGHATLKLRAEWHKAALNNNKAIKVRKDQWTTRTYSINNQPQWAEDTEEEYEGNSAQSDRGERSTSDLIAST